MQTTSSLRCNSPSLGYDLLYFWNQQASKVLNDLFLISALKIKRIRIFNAVGECERTFILLAAAAPIFVKGHAPLTFNKYLDGSCLGVHY